MAADTYSLISEKFGIALFIEEHRGEPSYQQRLKGLQGHYCAVRRTSADGSCFYRGLGFAFLESLIGKPQNLLRFRERVTQSERDLIAAGFQDYVYRPHYETNVEPLTAVCDHIQISAVTQALDIPLQVEYVDPRDTAITQLAFPEGSHPAVYMVYSEDHYTLLYKEGEAAPV